MWQQWAFVAGLVAGITFGVSATLYMVNERITALRVALGDLVRAVDEGDWRPYRETKTGTRTLEAMRRALEVLER